MGKAILSELKELQGALYTISDLQQEQANIKQQMVRKSMEKIEAPKVRSHSGYSNKVFVVIGCIALALIVIYWFQVSDYIKVWFDAEKILAAHSGNFKSIEEVNEAIKGMKEFFSICLAVFGICVVAIFIIAIMSFIKKKKELPYREKEHENAMSTYRAMVKEKTDVFNARENARIAELKPKLDAVENALNAENSKLHFCDILPPELKNIADVKKIKTYFEQRRADTIKEAINLLYSEKSLDSHRQKLEQAAEDIVLAEERRANAAELAAISARHAAENSRFAYQENLKARQSVEDIKKKLD